VEARPEPVLALFPENYEAAVRIAFDVGNRHFSLASDGDTLLVPDDTAMEDLVRRLGVRWERREAVYSPLHGGGDA
jgi:urease accessory protein UreE